MASAPCSLFYCLLISLKVSLILVRLAIAASHSGHRIDACFVSAIGVYADCTIL